MSDSSIAVPALRATAIDLLLTVDPATAWPELVREYRAKGKQLLLECPSLAGSHFHSGVNLVSWPGHDLAELAWILFEAFPPEDDPKRTPGEGFAVGLDDEFRRLRSQVISVLFDRASPDAETALTALAHKHAPIQQWIDKRRAQRSASNILREMATAEEVESLGTVPVHKVVKVLADTRFRLLRTPADLQAVVVEEIHNIDKDAKEHLSMLYTPRKRRSKEGSEKQTILQEDALQAYFYCRLNDRLVGPVFGGNAKVILNREPLASKDQRLDIKVQASCIGGNTATVVIELKWSRHPDLSVSLTDQLGTKYLVDEKLTHGIYLVGWMGRGRWSRRACMKRPAKLKSAEDWLRALQMQSAGFAQNHPEIVIVPVVVDLCWG